MSSQVLSKQTVGVELFAALLRAHAAATKRLNAQLFADHGLTINDYEVLIRLARAPDRRMRRVDLAEQVLLTPSGITRLLDGLERSGYVERASCDSDRRVVYAVLTESGLEKLLEARTTHLAQIDEHFGLRLDGNELEAALRLLSRLADGAEVPCDPGASPG
jgi:DNA-binding MarR family transcriptional regulator